MNDLGRHYDHFLHNRVTPRGSQQEQPDEQKIDLTEKIRLKREMEKEKEILADRQREIMVEVALRKAAIADHLPTWHRERKHVREKSAWAMRQRAEKAKQERDKRMENEYRQLERQGEEMIKRAREERRKVRDAMFIRKAAVAKQDQLYVFIFFK